MNTATRKIKTYTIDPEIDRYITTTKRGRSASERVNELLRRAMMEEATAKLEAEAAAFFAAAQGKHRKGTVEFQEAAIRSFSRDDD